jgi:hypothetical protein
MGQKGQAFIAMSPKDPGHVPLWKDVISKQSRPFSPHFWKNATGQFHEQFLTPVYHQ